MINYSKLIKHFNQKFFKQPLLIFFEISTIFVNCDSQFYSGGGRMAGKRISSIGGIVVIIAVSAWLAHYFYLRHIYIISEDAFQKAKITSVSTQDVSGKITKLFVKEFSTVHKGDPLFKIDDSIYKKQVAILENKIKALEFKKASLQTKLKKLENQLPEQVKMVKDKLNGEMEQLSILDNKEKLASNRYKTSVTKAQETIKAAEKGTEAARTNFKMWNNRFERFENLYNRGIISKQQFEEVKTGYKSAEFKYRESLAKLVAAKENLKSAESLKNNIEIVKKERNALKSQISVTKREVRITKENLKAIEELKNSIKALTKEIDATEKGVEKTKIFLSHTLVKSPVNGTVAKKWREKGEFVSPGLPVYSLYNPNSFYILAWIEEDRIKDFKVGSKVKAELEICGKEFEGKVTSIGKAAGSEFALIPRDPSQGEFTKVTQRIPVKINIKNVPETCIKPGTSVTVYIHKD